MKYLYSMFFFLMMTSLPVHGVGVSGVFKGGYFYPDDQELAELYKGGFMVERELNYSFMSNILAWGSMGFLRKAGELHETDEKTRIMLIPVGLGLKLRVGIPFIPMVRLYGGGGATYMYVDVKNESKIVTKNIHNHGVGWVAKAGVQLVAAYSFIAEAFVNYLHHEMTLRDIKHGEEEKVKTNVGGWVFGVGVGYQF